MAGPAKKNSVLPSSSSGHPVIIFYVFQTITSTNVLPLINMPKDCSELRCHEQTQQWVEGVRSSSSNMEAEVAIFVRAAEKRKPLAFQLKECSGNTKEA